MDDACQFMDDIHPVVCLEECACAERSAARRICSGAGAAVAIARPTFALLRSSPSPTPAFRRALRGQVPRPVRSLGAVSNVAMALRSGQLGLLVVVAFLCVASTAGNGENEAEAMVEGIATRHLLQTVSPCPIDFSTQNYSVVTSVCNASNLVLSVCCDAFIDFACPFASYINDPTTNCNYVMFTYLNMAGNYPPQLFQSCQGDAQGLPCPLTPAPSPNPSSATMDMPWRLSSLVIFLFTFVHLVKYS